MIYKENIIICVDDLSREFNKSKATIYKKLKTNKELKKPIIRKDRKTYISAEAVQWLQTVYKSKSNNEEEVKNNLPYKNIEENTVLNNENITIEPTLNTNLSTDENNIEPTLNNNLITDENIKEKDEDNISKNLFLEENICNLEKSTLNTIENVEYSKEPLIVPTKKTYDNIVTSEEAIPTTEFSSNERIPLSVDNEVFGLLKSYVKFLETECTTKNKQLDNKDDIIKNMQVLLENEQQIVSSQLNLEDRCREMDDKLFQLKGQLETRQKKHKKGFFKKIFKL